MNLQLNKQKSRKSCNWSLLELIIRVIPSPMFLSKQSVHKRFIKTGECCVEFSSLVRERSDRWRTHPMCLFSSRAVEGSVKKKAVSALWVENVEAHQECCKSLSGYSISLGLQSEREPPHEWLSLNNMQLWTPNSQWLSWQAAKSNFNKSGFWHFHQD